MENIFLINVSRLLERFYRVMISSLINGFEMCAVIDRCASAGSSCLNSLYDMLITHLWKLHYIIPQHDRICSSKITTFRYFGRATFFTCTFLTWLLIAHSEGKATLSILSHRDVGAMRAIKYTLYGSDRDIFMTSQPIKINTFF